MSKPTAIRRAAVCAACLAPAAMAFAQTPYVWTRPTSGNWSDAANWSSATVPPSSPNTQIAVDFTVSNITATNNLPAPFELNTLSLYSSNLTIAGNTLRFFGSPAAPAELTASAPFIRILNPIDLAAELSLFGDSGARLQGPISGPGELVAAGTESLGSPPSEVVFTLAAVNTYTGGTTVDSARLAVAPGATLGPGPVTVAGPVTSFNPAVSGGPRYKAGKLFLDSAANVTGGARSVTVAAGGYVQFTTLQPAALDTLHTASAGVLGLAADSAAPLDLSPFPSLRLGANSLGQFGTGGVTYTGILTPAADTYRFGGQANRSAVGTTDAGILNVASLLTDGPRPRSVNLGTSGMTTGGRITLRNPANAYTGGTVVEGGAQPANLYFDYAPAPGQTPLGTGPVDVHGTLSFAGPGAVADLPNTITLRPGGTLAFVNTYPGDPVNRWGDARPVTLDSARIAIFRGSEKVGAVAFDGRSRLVVQFATATLAATSLHRQSRGTLELQAPGNFGTTNAFKVDDPAPLVDPSTGMVAPYIVGNISTAVPDGASGDYLTVDAAGVFQRLSYTAAFNATPNEIPNLSGGGTLTLSADQTAHALRFNGNTNVLLSSGRTLTLTSGGLLFHSGTISGSGTLSFASANAVVYSGGPTTNSATLSARVDGSNGLTKFGSARLTLSGNNTFTGGVTVNDGTLTLAHPGALNASAPNAVTLTRFATLSVLNGVTVTAGVLSGEGTLSVVSSTLRLAPGHTVNRAAAITLNSGATLDLSDSSLLLDYDPYDTTGLSPAAAVARIAAAYNHGLWDQPGITSSAAANDPTHATSLGYADDGATLQIRYTWTGDANLDGLVTPADLQALMTGMQSPPSSSTWSTGDFNYDGTTDADDYTLFQLGSASATTNLLTPIPEPTSVLAVLPLLLLPRTRRPPPRPS